MPPSTANIGLRLRIESKVFSCTRAVVRARSFACRARESNSGSNNTRYSSLQEKGMKVQAVCDGAAIVNSVNAASVSLSA